MGDKALFEKRINCKIRGVVLYIKLVVASFLMYRPEAASTACGGYLDIGSGSTTFQSPNAPIQYDVATNCIWIVESAAYHRVNLTFSFTGERYSGDCSDYLEIRDGGPTSPVIGTYCDTHSGINVESTNVWMYLQLKSDQISGSGTYLDASVKAIRNTTTPYDLTDRVPECRSYEFECSNHMCISMSYRCDNYNDCGCIDDCDEDGCGSLTINLATQVSVSVVVGVTVFFCICLLAYIIERKNSWNSHKTKISEDPVKESRKQSQAMYKLKQNTKAQRMESALKLTDCEN